MGGTWETAKNTRKRWFLGTKTTNCRPGHFYTFYSWQKFDIFCYIPKRPKLKTLFLFFKMLIYCWGTRVESYPTSASKIKSTNCLAWPHQYFLFMADGWNFCGVFLRPKTKNTFFLFFKMLVHCRDKRVKIYPSCESKIKSSLPIIWPGHIYTFCLWQTVEIFVVYS